MAGMSALRDPEIVGARLRDVRRSRGETIRSAAQAMGVSESLLCRIEKGRRRAQLTLLERASDYYDVPVEHLSPVDPAPTGPRPVSPVTLLQDTRVGFSQRDDSMRLADIALTASIHGLRGAIESSAAVDRYQACRMLTELASRPLEILREIAEHDEDHSVRAGARQLLQLLSEAYDV